MKLDQLSPYWGAGHNLSEAGWKGGKTYLKLAAGFRGGKTYLNQYEGGGNRFNTLNYWPCAPMINWR